MRFRAIVVAGFLVLGLAAPSQALKIVLNNSMSIPVGPGEFAVFQEAAKRWEAVIATPMTLTLEVELDGSLPMTRLGQASAYATVAGRPDTATVAMNPTPITPFFVDPTPSVDSDEFQLGIVSPPWLYPAQPLGLADGFYDLLTLAIHEIGHALGMSSAFTNLATNIVAAPTTSQYVYVFQSPATIGNPVADYFAGVFYTHGGVYMPQSEDDTEEGGSSGGLPSHTDSNSSGGTVAATFTIDTMSPNQNLSERIDISFVDLDILADAYGYDLTGYLPKPPVPALGGLALLTLTAGLIGAAFLRLRRPASR